MGEVLQGPWGERRGARSPEGNGRVPATSGPAGLEPIDSPSVGSPSADSPSADPVPIESAAAVPEPAWAVPGVDADEPVPVPPTTRAGRRAEHVAIAALTRHDASEGEIRAKLLAKGLEDDEVEAELARLRSAGLIDDAAFAARLVERLRERKGAGDGVIRGALRTRLVPQDVVDQVLADLAEDEDDVEARLQQVADDRARRLGSLAYDVAERRLSAYLMRKGYRGPAVRAATRSALESAGIR